MLNVTTGMRFGKLLLGAFMIVCLAGPAFAGTVYSWVSDDGTYAFTDDLKRIPAKHRANATKRSMERLTRYERYTPITSERGKSYAERIRERQTDLREMTAAAPQGAVAGAIASKGPGIGYTVPVSGDGASGRSTASLWVPATGSASVDSEPTTIESIRVKPSDSLATRHWTVVKQGDQILTVIKGERRQRPLQSVSEDDFDL